MTPQAQELGWQTRLMLQVQCHWFDIITDTLGLISSVTSSLLLVTIGISLLEIGVAVIDSLIQLNRLKRVLQELDVVAVFSEEKDDVDMTFDEHQTCKHYLHACISHEQKRLFLRVITLLSVNTLIIVKLSLPFILSSAIVSPVIPFVMASLLLSVTLVGQLLTKMLDSKKPVAKVISAGQSNQSFVTHSWSFFSGKRDNGMNEVRKIEDSGHHMTLD